MKKKNTRRTDRLTIFSSWPQNKINHPSPGKAKIKTAIPIKVGGKSGKGKRGKSFLF
jgi:hypothetical protein